MEPRLYSVVITFTPLPIVRTFEEFIVTSTMLHGKMSTQRAVELIDALILEWELSYAPDVQTHVVQTSPEELAMGEADI